jgi:hypothetical protein
MTKPPLHLAACGADKLARPRDRAGIRTALEARDALRAQPAQQALDIGGHGTRTQPSLF